MAPATHRLTGVDVRYISLAGRPKNRRTMILKSDLAQGETLVERETRIVKADPVRRMAYGVVYAPGMVDDDGHTMDAAEIEKAMLGFMQKGRVGAVDTDHDEQTGGAYVAESWLVKADAAGATCDPLFPDDTAGTWVVGIKVDDGATWDRIEKGEITGLSFAGVAALVPVGDTPDAGTPAVQKGAPLDATGETAAETMGAALLRKAKDLLGLGDETADATPAVTTPADATPVTATDETPDPMEKADKSGVAVVRRSLEEPVRPTSPTSGGLTLDEIRAAMTETVADAVAPLVERIDAVEKQTAGRQSAVGDDVRKSDPPPRGLRILG